MTTSNHPSGACPGPFEAAKRAWAAGAPLRSQRERMKRFTYGRQWDDPVTMPDGSVVTMGQRARLNLCEPVTSNLVRQIVKSVVGRYRAETARGDVPRDIAEANRLDELDARTLEEFLISGCAIQRVGRDARPEGPGPWVDIVSPSRFFVNPHRDPRGHDIEVIGMVHDWSFPELLARMAPDANPRAAEALAQLYADCRDDCLPGATLGADPFPGFDAPEAPGRCRVVEVWTRGYGVAIECHDPETGRLRAVGPAEARRIVAVDNPRREASGRLPLAVRRRRVVSWTGSWYSPAGRLLRRTSAPLPRHPFVVRLYPLIDGEVHPFIEDVIDRQIQVNRTLTMVDRVMAVAAKEIVLMPAEALLGGEHWKLADYARAWGSPGAVIPYKSMAAKEPPQILNSAGINAGLSNLLAVEMQMMEQVSGVTSALQGQQAPSGSTATLYRAQADNAAVALTDIFATFASFCRSRDALLMKKINPE